MEGSEPARRLQHLGWGRAVIRALVLGPRLWNDLNALSLAPQNTSYASATNTSTSTASFPPQTQCYIQRYSTRADGDGQRAHRRILKADLSSIIRLVRGCCTRQARILSYIGAAEGMPYGNPRFGMRHEHHHYILTDSEEDRMGQPQSKSVRIQPVYCLS